jgi:hypothetical protein
MKISTPAGEICLIERKQDYPARAPGGQASPGRCVMNEPDRYYTRLRAKPEPAEMQPLAQNLFDSIFRTHLDSPGFAVIGFATAIEPSELRRFLVELKQEFGQIYHAERQKYLVYRSMMRFDQQVTTRFHLDGAPEESYLMLGYEPSEVQSELAIADYTRAAYDLGMTPALFLADFQRRPDFSEQILTDYITPVREFDSSRPHVWIVNNSRLPFRPEEGNSLGVMHQATIINPQPGKRRIVNSTMLCVVSAPSEEFVSASEQQEYLTTTAISGT